MYILLIFVSAAAAVLYLLSSLFQLLRGHARAGFWGTFFIFTVVICALIAVYETTSSSTLVQTIALGIAAVLIVVDLIFALFETRLTPRVMKTSRALLGIAGGIIIAIGVVAFPYRLLALQALGQRTASTTGGQFGQGTTQNAAFTQGQGSAGTTGTGSQGAAALTVTKPTEASQALESETGLKVEEVLQHVTGGESIASLVAAHKGDLTKVTTALTDTIKQMVADAVTAGTIQQTQADRMTGTLDQTVTAAVQGQLPAQAFDRLVGPAITGQPMTAGFGGNRGGANGANGASASGTAEVGAGGTGGGFGSGRNTGASGTPQAGGGFGSGRNTGASGTPEATAEAGSGGGFGTGRNFGSGGANSNGTAEPVPPANGSGGTAGGGFAGGTGGNVGGGFTGNGGGFGGQIAAAPTATLTPFPTATALPPRPTEIAPTPTNTPYVIATMTPAGTPGAPTPGAAAGSTTTTASGSAGASTNAATNPDGTLVCTGYTNHNVNLRSAANTKSDVLMTVTASAQLQIDGRSADSTWLAVTFQDKSGWMDTQFIQLVGKCDAIPEKTP